MYFWNHVRGGKYGIMPVATVCVGASEYEVARRCSTWEISAKGGLNHMRFLGNKWVCRKKDRKGVSMVME